MRCNAANQQALGAAIQLARKIEPISYTGFQPVRAMSEHRPIFILNEWI